MKRVLVCNPYGIGDCLFMTPLLKALKQETSAERVDVLLGSRTEAVFKDNPNVDGIYFLDKDALSKLSPLVKAWRFLKFYGRLKKNRYDTFFDLSLTREYAFFAKFHLRIPKRIGFNYKNRGIYLNFKQDLPEGFSEGKVAEYYTGLLKLAGVTVPEKQEMEFPVSDLVKKRMESALRERGIPRGARVACVSAGGGESWGKDAHFKQWSPDFFRELLEKIHLAFPLDAVLFIGGSKDDPLNREVSQNLSISAHHFAGQLTLEETAACMLFARFVLVNEGGLYHLAASQKVPVISIVGPVDEKVYQAVGEHSELVVTKDNLDCRPCYRAFRYKSDCPHRACLKELTPEEVYRKILQSRFLHQLETASALQN